jgi:hypothetical protein
MGKNRQKKKVTKHKERATFEDEMDKFQETASRQGKEIWEVAREEDPDPDQQEHDSQEEEKGKKFTKVSEEEEKIPRGKKRTDSGDEEDKERDEGDEDEEEEDSDSDSGYKCKGVEGLIEIQNPNRSRKAGEIVLNRKEKEMALAEVTNRKLIHLQRQGKTAQAAADLAALAEVKKRREEAALKREEEKKKKEEEKKNFLKETISKPNPKIKKPKKKTKP